LPETILIQDVSRAENVFHARFSAKGKRYLYKLKIAHATPFECRYLWNYYYPLDFTLLQKTLALFKGKWNFSSFAGGVNTEETPTKELKNIGIFKKGHYITITLVGSGFLYKMARSIVGTAMEVARGKLPIARVKGLLKTPKRTHEVITAPAKGLILDKVFY
jgi:tRNA pseudouridine38-40 synthase